MKVQKYSQDSVMKAPAELQEARMVKLEEELSKISRSLQTLMAAEYPEGENVELQLVHLGDVYLSDENNCAVHAGFNGRLSGWLLYSEDIEDLTELVEFVSSQYFEKQHFHKIEAEPLSSNGQVIVALESAGFTKVGIRKMNRLIGNRWVDTLLMEKLNPALTESPVETIEIKKQDEGELPVLNEQGEEAKCSELPQAPRSVTTLT